MNNDTLREIYKFSEEVLYCLYDEVTFPVSSLDIIHMLGGEVISSDSKFHSKIINNSTKGKCDNFKIYTQYQSNLDLAIQLGYIFLVMDFLHDDRWFKNTHFKDDIENFNKENYSKYSYATAMDIGWHFAISLLMPFQEFEMAVWKYGSDVIKYTEHFNVNNRAVRSRGKFLGFFK